MPIEKIKVGDKVWARNERTGATELRKVTAIAPQHFDKLMELRIAGEKKALHPTPTHPFWARRKVGEAAHWIEAADLIQGMQLLSQNGRWLTIASVAALNKPAVVYNFTVEEDHDYFVGDQGLLVHNTDPCPCGRRTPEENRRARNTYVGSVRSQVLKCKASPPHGPRPVRGDPGPGAPIFVLGWIANDNCIQRGANGRAAGNSCGALVFVPGLKPVSFCAVQGPEGPCSLRDSISGDAEEVRARRPALQPVGKPALLAVLQAVRGLAGLVGRAWLVQIAHGVSVSARSAF